MIWPPDLNPSLKKPSLEVVIVNARLRKDVHVMVIVQ